MLNSTMEGGLSGRLVGSEIHGFHTLQDLDVGNMMDEARARWLRPNEIHAMLCNYKYFTIYVKPVHLPKSGTIVLFDRKMLRNFRKDGHNWKKKKDGKTVKEAHEHLKVGNEERIHVYYAHGQDNPTFVRRCYWLLDKALEHIVLVHYRETQELQDSPGTPVNSHSSSVSDQSAPWPLSEEFDSGAGHSPLAGPSDSLTIRNHEMRLHEINTLEWDDLVANDPNYSMAPKGDNFSHIGQANQTSLNGSLGCNTTLPPYSLPAEIPPMANLSEPIIRRDNIHLQVQNNDYSQPTGLQSNVELERKYCSIPGSGDSLDILVSDSLQSQDSFGRWVNYMMAELPVSSDNVVLETPISSCDDSNASPSNSGHQSLVPEQIFVITDVSPAWAFSTETTKILITGYFHEQFRPLAKSNLYCVCGDVCISVEIVQDGVYRCFISPHSPGLVNLYLGLDIHKPISQILNFDYRTPLPYNPVSLDDKSNWEEFQVQMRLVNLLLSTSKRLDILTSKVPPANVKEAKKFATNTSHISNSWTYFKKSIEDNRISFTQAKDSLFELTLKSILKEWLLERVIEGCKTTEYDAQGQGVIHLCAILGYTWAVHLFSWSGLSLDFRDKHGWTALHWASYCGREKMVAVLLSAGAKPSRVTDPTPDNPGGCTAADLASAKGYDGLAAYLSEKALVSHFEDMSIAGNVSGSLQTSVTETVILENLTEEELYLKDTLEAYRTAADAAARIQAAFREHSLKVQTKAVQFANPEEEARNIIAAMKIQHAFRNFDTRKKMAAAARIQYRFRTWKMRKQFLNMRHQVIKIQAAFRGFQVRRQYRKIIWSVGVLEKVILRWRLKRKGFRGLRIDPVEAATDQVQEGDIEEDFYKTSRKQAEERVQRSVVRVQAMFRSKKAQEEYRRMKMAHYEAKVQYHDFLHPDTDMS